MARTDNRVIFALASLLVPVTLASAQTGGPGGRPASNDAVITYNRPPPTFGAPAEETWYKHGETVRIDQRSTKHPDILIQQFTHPGQTVSFTLIRSANGHWLSLSLAGDPVASLPSSDIRTFTGATETHLGETCRVWQVDRHTEYDTDFRQSGCVTATGIELWWRQANIGTIVATSIIYRPVRSSDVRVPVEALDINAWEPLSRSADHRGDYQVILRGPAHDDREFQKTRSGPWEATTTRDRSGSSRFSLVNKIDGLKMSLFADRKGKRSLAIGRQLTTSPPQSLPQKPVRLASRPDETILGTVCQWWNTMPNVSDAGESQCLTSDGIPLAIVRSSWGSAISSMEAQLLRRSPQPIAAVAPDRQIQTAGFWGF